MMGEIYVTTIAISNKQDIFSSQHYKKFGGLVIKQAQDLQTLIDEDTKKKMKSDIVSHLRLASVG